MRTTDFFYKVGQVVETNGGKVLITDRHYTKKYNDKEMKTYDFKCLICGHKQKDISEYTHKKGHGCKECARNNSKGQKVDFKYNIGDVINNLTIISRDWTNYYDNKKHSRSRKIYGYKCNICGHKGTKREGRVAITGCKKCCQKIIEEDNSIWTTHKYLVDDFGLDEEFAKTHSYGQFEKGRFICPDCGNPIYNYPNVVIKTKSLGCPCGDGFSRPSKYVKNMLTQLKNNGYIINYNQEVKKYWNTYINSKNKVSQAYTDFTIITLDNREIPIEVDGEFHRRDNDMSGQTKEYSVYIDNQKDKNWLINTGEETIRISDEGDFKTNILNSKLIKLFPDLEEIINWEECAKFSMTSLKVEVCKMWNEGKKVLEIADIYNLSKSTIINYLKQGAEAGLCNYNPKKEMERSFGNRKKPIKMFDKDDILLGIFESASYLSRKSEELFGIKLKSSNISKSSNNNGKLYKGYKFKKATKEEYEEAVKNNTINKRIDNIELEQVS